MYIEKDIAGNTLRVKSGYLSNVKMWLLLLLLLIFFVFPNILCMYMNQV